MSKHNAKAKTYGAKLAEVKEDLFGELEQSLTGNSYVFASC